MPKLSITLFLATAVLAGSLLAENRVVFRGTVQLEEPREVVLLQGRTELGVFPVAEDGTFKGEVELDSMRQLMLLHGAVSAPLFVKPGREITVDFGTERMDYTFSGSPETRLYTDARFVIYPGDVQLTNPMSWDMYKRYMQQGLEAKLRYIEVFCQAHPDIPDAWREEVEDFTRYSNYAMHINWPRFHLQAVGASVFEEEDDWRAYLRELTENIEWNEPRLRRTGAFASFAEWAITEEVRENHPDGSFLINAFTVVREKVDVPEMREFFVNRLAQQHLANEPVATREDAKAVARELLTNPNYLAALETIEERAAATGAGAPAMDFTLEDAEGNKVSLSDFRGQVVYLDFWATWCGPCLAEIPHLKRLKADLADRDDIVIVAVSIDRERDKEKWRTMVADLELGENQLFAGEQVQEISRGYEVRGIPHFVIIDREGRIHQNRTVRPSNPQTRRMLEQLADS
ncbi:MAG: AhpC/TSA family protein [Puniceicoccaceae bacterium]|nr:MAG: AhpC/TSA family protein [Puniceicoccaceae bacterium]